ncbi:hypothetical protein B9Z55_000037 [Caenorhabditis nigoni]|nr:hypothetical protein B9Z55_000037 [Caenorhabditis nigoni]
MAIILPQPSCPIKEDSICSKTSFQMWTPPSILLLLLIGASSVSGYPPGDTQQIIWDYLNNTSNPALASRDPVQIEKILYRSFLFRGCKAHYKKADAVKIIAAIPREIDLSMKVISTTWLPNDHIQTMLVVPKQLFNGNPDAQFEYCTHYNVWWGGQIPWCSLPFGYESADVSEDVGQEYLVGKSLPQEDGAPEDPKAVVQKFLEELKEVMKSKDSGRIGKLFNDNYLFQGCRGSYTKEDAVQKIAALPADASIEFSLESAKWAIHGQIEYIVSIAGPGMDKIQAEFLYCPFTNVLKSGKVPNCAAN